MNPHDFDSDSDDLEFDSDFDSDDFDEEPAVPDSELEVDPRLQRDVQRGLRDLQANLGRPLTGREADGVIEGALRRVFQTQTHVDAGAAIVDSGSGVKPLLSMNEAEHRAWARERASEKYAAANPELDDIEYDPDTFEGMRTYAKARADGYEPDADEWGDE